MSADVARAIARQTGADASHVLYGDTLGPAGSRAANYIGMLVANADSIVRGLTGRAMPERDEAPRGARTWPPATTARRRCGTSPSPPSAVPASGCWAPTAAARRRCSGCCCGELRASGGTRRAGRPLRHGPADRALAARLSGERARRRADGRAAPLGVVAAARPRRAARGARGACDGGPGRRRTRDVRRAFRGPAPARADRACAGAGGRPAAARRAVLGPRRPQLRSPDGVDRRPRAGGTRRDGRHARHGADARLGPGAVPERAARSPSARRTSCSRAR